MTGRDVRPVPSWRRYLRFWRPDVEGDIDDELRFHIEERVEELVASGVDANDARSRVMAAFGDVTVVRAQLRTIGQRASTRRRRVERLHMLGRDVRRTLRRLRRHPAFAIPAVITLAVGIGAATGIFALVRGILLSPLPYPRAGQLVAVANVVPGIGLTQGGLSDGTFFHYRKHNRVFEDVGAYFDRTLSITEGEAPERISAALATPSVFAVLQVPAYLGRFCRDGDDTADPSRVVLGYDLWVRRYGADPRVLGRMIEINRLPREIVGVAPRAFRFPFPDTQLWFCMSVDSTRAAVRDVSWNGIARLRDGISADRAQSDLQRLIPALVGAYPDATPSLLRDTQLRAVVTPFKDVVVSDVRPALLLLTVAVLLVLAIAWANVSNLFLARAERRRHEVAIARALGASSGDLARLLFAESMSVSVLGGALAIGLAYVGVATRFGFAPDQIPRLHEVRLDAVTVGLATLLTLITGTLLGGASLARVTGSSTSSVLRSGLGRATPSKGWQHAQRTLVAVQVMLALTLLVASGSMLRSVRRMQNVPLGFDPVDALTFEIELPFRGYDTYQKGAHFFHELTRRLRAMPGVLAADAAYGVPLTPTTPFVHEPVLPVGSSERSPAVPTVAVVNAITPGFFGTMRIPLVAGRAFRSGDLTSEQHPVIVSVSLARRLFGTDNALSALGQRLRVVKRRRDPIYTVVGVVGDVVGSTIAGGVAQTLYVPLLEDLAATPNAEAPFPYYPGGMTAVVRTAVPALSVAASAGRIVSALDRQLPVAHVRTLEQIVRAATARARLTALLLLVAAGAALVVGTVGMYGVVSYTVAQRTAEFGIRLALGASPEELRVMIVRQGLRVASFGVAAGLVVAFVVMRTMRGVLYEVSPTDPFVYTATTVLVLLIAGVASYIPGRRASATEPSTALRSA